MSLLKKCVNDLDDALSCSADKANHSHNRDDNVPNNHEGFLSSAGLVPEDAGLDHRWECQPEGGETQGAEQGDEQLDIWNGDSKQD